MMQKIGWLGFAGSTLACIVLSSPARAITLSVGGNRVAEAGLVSTVVQANTIDFDNNRLPTTGAALYSVADVSAAIVSGSLGGKYITPSANTTSYLSVAPPTSEFQGTSPLTIHFSESLDYFGLYWGSIDSFNFVDFYSGDRLLQTFSGLEVLSVVADPSDYQNGSAYVNFFADSGEAFDTVVLRSEFMNSFESDNHAYRSADSTESIPESNMVIGLLTLGVIFGLTRILR